MYLLCLGDLEVIRDALLLPLGYRKRRESISKASETAQCTLLQTKLRRKPEAVEGNCYFPAQR